MIKCLLTEFGRARRENIWLSVMKHGPRCARSVRHDLEPNIFPSGPPTQSISTYYLLFLFLIYVFIYCHFIVSILQMKSHVMEILQ